MERLEARMDRLRLRNGDALDELMKSQCAAALQAYKAQLGNKIASAPVHHPDEIEGFQRAIKGKVISDVTSRNVRFKDELEIYLPRLREDIANEERRTKVENSRKIQGFCKGQKDELVARVAAAVSRCVDAR